MKIFITGGTGFVGTRACELFRESGHQCVAFDQLPFVIDSPATFIQGDVRDRDRLLNATRGCDAILHLAAAHHDFGISTETFADVNIAGTRNVCDAATANSIKKLCFYSSVAVYGSANPPLDESATPKPESEYGKTKLAAESVCRQWADSNEANQCLVIRPTVVFGPENFANMYTLIRQIDRGRFIRVGKMDNIKSLAHVDNLLQATLDLWLGNHPAQSNFEIFNYVDKPDLKSFEIVDAIYSGLGRRVPWLSIPYPLARLMALPFDVIIKLTGKNLPVSSSRIRKLAKANTQFEADRIHRTLARDSVPLKDAILEMVQWYRKIANARTVTDRRPRGR